MDKEKEIAEMVGILAASNNPFVDVPIEIMTNVAESLYNAGYRKVPDGAVVLLIGENNQALDEKTIEYFVKHNEQIRRDTAKEFAEKLKAKLFSVFGKTICSDFDTEDITIFIDELLKEYEK